MSFISQIKLILVVFRHFLALMLAGMFLGQAFAQNAPTSLNVPDEVYDGQNSNRSLFRESTTDTKSQVEVLEDFLAFYPDLEDIEELEKSILEQQANDPQSQLSQEGVENLSHTLLQRGGVEHIEKQINGSATEEHHRLQNGSGDIKSSFPNFNDPDSVTSRDQHLQRENLQMLLTDKEQLLEAIKQKNHHLLFNQNTFLHEAVVFADLETVRFIVQNSNDINAQNNMGFTALHLALMNQKEDITKYLLEQESIDLMKKNMWGDNIIHIALLAKPGFQAQHWIANLNLLMSERHILVMRELWSEANIQGERPIDFIFREEDSSRYNKLWHLLIEKQVDFTLDQALANWNLSAIRFFMQYSSIGINSKSPFLNNQTPLAFILQSIKPERHDIEDKETALAVKKRLNLKIEILKLFLEHPQLHMKSSLENGLQTVYRLTKNSLAQKIMENYIDSLNLPPFFKKPKRKQVHDLTVFPPCQRFFKS